MSSDKLLIKRCFGFRTHSSSLSAQSQSFFAGPKHSRNHSSPHAGGLVSSRKSSRTRSGQCIPLLYNLRLLQVLQTSRLGKRPSLWTFSFFFFFFWTFRISFPPKTFPIIIVLPHTSWFRSQSHTGDLACGYALALQSVVTGRPSRGGARSRTRSIFGFQERLFVQT